MSQHLAFHSKELLEEKIEKVLDKLDFTAESRREQRERTREKAERARIREEKFLERTETIPVVNEGPGLWKEEGHEEPMVEGEEEIEGVKILPEVIGEEAKAVGGVEAVV